MLKTSALMVVEMLVVDRVDGWVGGKGHKFEMDREGILKFEIWIVCWNF